MEVRVVLVEGQENRARRQKAPQHTDHSGRPLAVRTSTPGSRWLLSRLLAGDGPWH